MADDLNDDFVATLLKKEAVDKTSRYNSAAGLQAFLPRRSTTNAPKPNTRFLRNIVREADSHNAALRAKELADSRSRLRTLHRPEPRKESSRHSMSAGHGRSEVAERSKRKRSSSRSPYRDRHRDRRDRHKRLDVRGTSPERTKERDYHRTRRRREGRSQERSRRDSSRSRSRASSSDRNAESTRPHRRHHRSKDRDRKHTSHRGREDMSREEADKIPNVTKQKKGRRRSASSSSDPLDEIIGPAPPSPAPLSRGRGVPRGQSAMDSHFNESYDPSVDVRVDSDEGGDWDNAIEAYRDRQKWKAQHADRLRSAGFEEGFIEAWEANKTKNEDNLKWAPKGSTREWDRGKVVESETGEINLRADWTRK